MSCPHKYDERFIAENIEDDSFNKHCKIVNCANLYYEDGRFKCIYGKNPYILGNGKDKYESLRNTISSEEELNALKEYAFFLGGLDVTDNQK